MLAAVAAFAACAGAALLPPAAAAAPRPVVVAGGESLVAAGEAGFAASLARHAVRWLREAGLEADLADDRDLASTLEGRKVAMLAYCARTTPEQDKALRAFVEGGGRLIVCYSASRSLASLMGVTLGSYLRDPRGGRWARMHFAAERPANLPETVLQSSPNLQTAMPRSAAAHVLAWWEDRDGHRTGEAAWIQSPAGFWMTHVLLADGDERAKSQMLLALFAACDPGLWDGAARARIDAVALAPPFAGSGGAARAADAIADPARRHAAQESARLAAGMEARARALLDGGRPAEAWLAAEDWRNLLLRVEGYAQSPRPGEIHGVWDASGRGLYPGDWPKTCRLLRRAGVTDLFVRVAGAGFSHCRAAGLPPSPLLASGTDTLEECLAAAHPLGIRVHAWVVCFSLEQAPASRVADLRGAGATLLAANGGDLGWIDPSDAVARHRLADSFADIAAHYAVDGIHLDFARYPDFPSSLGARSRAAFERDRGKPIGEWPLSVNPGGAARREFMAWRARQVTAFVAEVRMRLALLPSTPWLTAAVYGKYPSCVEAVGQDWERWIEAGWIDYAIPMNYTEDPGLLRSLLARQSRTQRLRNHVLSGIGVTANESRLDASAVIAQAGAARMAGLPGFVLFDLDTALERDILPILQLGLTAPPSPDSR